MAGAQPTPIFSQINPIISTLWHTYCIAISIPHRIAADGTLIAKKVLHGFCFAILTPLVVCNYRATVPPMELFSLGQPEYKKRFLKKKGLA